ncbi:MAG: FeoA family protein [Candidatus Anstonellales archaeon]
MTSNEIDLSKAITNKHYVICKISSNEKAELEKLKSIGLNVNSKISLKRKINDFLIISFLDYDYAIELSFAKKIFVKQIQ